MAKFIELKIEVSDNLKKEILIAQLSEAGVDGFEEEKNVLKAFVAEDVYRADEIKEIIEQNSLKYSSSGIEEKNWNAEWESGFKPVMVGNFCCIRASFHEANTSVKHDIIITPKMSFGTGHHATTHMMVQAMEHINLEEASVFDFGTGTGVLAILAEKCGAANIIAVDNDAWSISNAEENFNSNNCHKILLFNNNKIFGNTPYDVILANINRNVILENLSFLKQHLAAKGVLLLSGLLTGDEPIIIEEANKNQLKLVTRLEMNGWLCLQLING